MDSIDSKMNSKTFIKLFDEGEREQLKTIKNGFCFACAEGRKDIALWLYESSKNDGNKININEDDNKAFRLYCIYRHIEMAQWVYELSKIDGNIPIIIDQRYDSFFDGFVMKDISM